MEKQKKLEEFKEWFWEIYNAHEVPHSSSAMEKHYTDKFSSLIDETKKQAQSEMRKECLKTLTSKDWINSGRQFDDYIKDRLNKLKSFI